MVAGWEFRGCVGRRGGGGRGCSVGVGGCRGAPALDLCCLLEDEILDVVWVGSVDDIFEHLSRVFVGELVHVVLLGGEVLVEGHWGQCAGGVACSGVCLIEGNDIFIDRTRIWGDFLVWDVGCIGGLELPEFLEEVV